MAIVLLVAMLERERLWADLVIEKIDVFESCLKISLRAIEANLFGLGFTVGGSGTGSPAATP